MYKIGPAKGLTFSGKNTKFKGFLWIGGTIPKKNDKKKYPNVASQVGVFASQVGVFASQVGVFASQVGVFPQKNRDHNAGMEPIKNRMGPNPNGPRTK